MISRSAFTTEQNEADGRVAVSRYQNYMHLREMHASEVLQRREPLCCVHHNRQFTKPVKSNPT